MNAAAASTPKSGRNAGGGGTLIVLIFFVVFLSTRYLPKEQPIGAAVYYRRVPSGAASRLSPNDEVKDEPFQTAGSSKLGSNNYIPSYSNVLPNPYLLDSINLTEYRNSILTFVHNPKSGGTTLKICLRRLGKVRPLILTKFNRADIETKFMNGILKPADHDVMVGGSSFGICESFSSRKCSYFTIVREPYDRMVSHYFFCQNGGQTSVPCENKTLEEFAIDASSILLHQLSLRVACRCDSGNCEYLGKHPWSCELDHNISHLYQTRKDILPELMADLERDFAVIGLTEEYETTLRILQSTFALPFYDKCRELRQNSGTYGTADKTYLDRRKEKAREILMNSERVRAVLLPDVILYRKCKEIFNKQKEKLLLI